MSIKQLENILEPYLKGKKLVSYTTDNLLSPGENYGSVLVKVDVKVRRGDGVEETLHFVAKTCPPSDFIRRLFATAVTFKKEAAMYSTIIPTLQEFQRSRGCKSVIKCFPSYYGSRLSLNPKSTEVDDDACLCLGNLITEGYIVVDRLKGCNLPTAEFIVRDLATFQAVSCALRILDPGLFKEKVLPYLITHVNDDTYTDEYLFGYLKSILTSASKNIQCSKLLDKLEARIKHNIENFRHPSRLDPGPFAAITHTDYWINNTMVKFNKDGQPIENAIVDFQNMILGNPLRDLVFFIYSSVSTELITKNFDHLTDVYYQRFIEVLQELKVDLGPFSRKAYLQQIYKAAKDVEVYHVLFMLQFVLKDKAKVKDLREWDDEKMSEIDSVHESYYPRLWLAIQDFEKRGWL